MNKRFIISIPTYKEAENIKQLIEEIIYHCNDQDLLKMEKVIIQV